MKEEKKYTVSSTHTNSSTTTRSLDLKQMEEKMKKLEEEYLRSFSGLPFVIDYSGLMCPPDGYIFMVGTRFGEKLRGLK